MLFKNNLSKKKPMSMLLACECQHMYRKLTSQPLNTICRICFCYQKLDGEDEVAVMDSKEASGGAGKTL